MSIEKVIMCSYTPGISAEGYIAFVFPFVCSLLSVALVEFTSMVSVKAHSTQVSDHHPLGYLVEQWERKKKQLKNKHPNKIKTVLNNGH